VTPIAIKRTIVVNVNFILKDYNRILQWFAPKFIVGVDLNRDYTLIILGNDHSERIEVSGSDIA